MKQRFTERERVTFFVAPHEAGRLGYDAVAPEHILLGLISEQHRSNVALHLLIMMGVSPGDIREEVELQLRQGEAHDAIDLRLDPSARKVIDSACREAKFLNNKYLGTQHLLLGLLHESEGLSARVLAQSGITLERVRAEVRTLQSNLDESVLQEASE